MAQIKDLLVLGKSTFLDSIKFNKQVDIFGNAASMPLRVRGIVGSSGEGVTGDLYLQYGANSKVMLGNSGGYYISAAGDYYSGKSANATNADSATVAGKISDITTNDNASSSDTWRYVWMSYSNNTTGRPAYDDRFAIQTSTGTLRAPTFSGNLVGTSAVINGLNVARQQTYNNLIHSGNEFTFAAPQYQGDLYINYRTASGSTDGNITKYIFCNGNKTTSGVTIDAAAFTGKAATAGHADTATAATTSSYPAGFSSNGGTISWGTLKYTDANGYQTVARWDSANGGSVAFADGPMNNNTKKGQTSMQIDGYYYQEEGTYQVLDNRYMSNMTQVPNGSGTATGLVKINTRLVVKGNGSSYNEGIRIVPASNGWSNIYFSDNKDETNHYSTGTNGWLLGRRGAAGSVAGATGDFTIECNNSTGVGLTLYAAGGGYLHGRFSATGGSFGYNNTSYALSANSFICNSWIRTNGQTGWYNESYGGGWYMTDSKAVRAYNEKVVTAKGMGDGDRYIAFPKGGQKCGLTSGSGYLTIYLPTAAFKTSVMVKFKVSIYIYSTGQTVDYIISGYNYTDGSWYNPSVVCIGPRNSYCNLPVYFGRNNAREIIQIGNSDTSWAYPNITISDVTLGHSGGYNNWADGWDINFTTTKVGNVTQTVTNTWQGYSVMNASYVWDYNTTTPTQLKIGYAGSQPSSWDYLAGYCTDGGVRALKDVSFASVADKLIAAKSTWGINITGSATRATYLGSSVIGNSTTPIYLTTDGLPTLCTGYGSAITNITRSGKTFTATRVDGTTFTFTQQDNNTTYSFTDKAATLDWNTMTTIATVGGVDITVGLPDYPSSSDTNYYHTPAYTSGTKIGTGTGVADLYVPKVDSASASAFSTGTSFVTERDAYYATASINGARPTSSVDIYAPTSAGTSGYILKSSGSGAPTWLQTLPVANGGTGQTSWSTNRLIYASAATTLTTSNIVVNASQLYYSTNGSGSLGLSNYVWGSVYATTFYASSDIRKKKDINPYVAKGDILTLPICTFKYIDREDQSEHLGCIAQDLQKICPELVNADDDGYLSIKENKLAYVLLERMKEMQKEINELKEGIKHG